MKELSIFVDESGDFGEYAKHSPFYIITMILHDQSQDISGDIASNGYDVVRIPTREIADTPFETIEKIRNKLDVEL